MGFFDHLSGNVEVLPVRPFVSGAEIYGGTNAKLVEITRINRTSKDEGLPSRLAEAVIRSCGEDRADSKELKGATWTIFAELIDNIFWFCRKVRFLGKIQKFGVMNSITYRLPNSRKSNFATEPQQPPAGRGYL